MPGKLKGTELSQWTEGNPDLIATLLFNLFYFLQFETNQGKDTHGVYQKAIENIGNFISLLGENRLHIPQVNKAAIDASALLGAYLRFGIRFNDQPLVELTEEQVNVVHSFVKPLIPEQGTLKQFFDSLEGSPSKKHATIVHRFLLNDISPEHQKEMFKNKYAQKVTYLIDSILKLVDFMRTPFRLLVLEEKASVAAAKGSGKESVQTSGIDLQWATMHKAIEQSLQDIVSLKKGKAEEANKFLEEIKHALKQCQTCFGMANTRYGIQKEFESALNKSDKQVQVLQKENEELKSKRNLVQEQITIINLKKQLELLQQENVQLKKELKIKTDLSIQNRVVPNFDEVKSDLLIKLGELLLNPGDTTYLRRKIKECDNQKSISAVRIEIMRLDTMNELIKTLNKEILLRTGFFSSDPHKKIRGIETTFQQLSLEEKHQLITLSEAEINMQLSKKNDQEDNIARFLKAIHHKRGFIPIHEAKSFTFFKQEIVRLKQDLDSINNVPEGIQVVL